MLDFIKYLKSGFKKAILMDGLTVSCVAAEKYIPKQI